VLRRDGGWLADGGLAVVGRVSGRLARRPLARPAALDRFGRVDSLVANAGIGAYGGILDQSDDELVEMINTNFTGTVWSVRAALPPMLEAGGGDIVIVSSVAGLRGGADEAVYAGTKFAQVGLAGAMDRELREKGVRVTTIAPAAVHTEFAIGRGRTEGAPWLDEVLRPEDVAYAVVTTLKQPRRMRTQLWSMWSMTQGS
jgi:NADP-dependent 3-hydroxy acid dehydrogenase YdfG